jgi:hypothetical protein
MPITILNRTRRPIVVILNHADFCERAGDCACETVAGRTVPGSLTVPALGASSGVHEACRNLRAVRARVKAGHLSCANEETIEAEPTAEEEPSGRRRRRGKQ